MNRRVMVRCPYCGHEITVDVSNDYTQKQVVTCDVMEGGCELDFVADVRVSITAKAFKIEGQEAGEGGQDEEGGKNNG